MIPVGNETYQVQPQEYMWMTIVGHCWESALYKVTITVLFKDIMHSKQYLMRLICGYCSADKADSSTRLNLIDTNCCSYYYTSLSHEIYKALMIPAVN